MREGKTIGELVGGWPANLQGLFQTLRSRALALGGVTEEVTRHEDSPTYRFRGKQLFHVHPTGKALGITVPLPSAVLVPRILADPTVRSREKQIIRRVRDYKGYRWAFFPLEDGEDVEAVLKVIALLHRHLAGAPGAHRTLEAFDEGLSGGAPPGPR